MGLLQPVFEFLQEIPKSTWKDGDTLRIEGKNEFVAPDDALTV
jgi:hypothetical protein